MKGKMLLEALLKRLKLPAVLKYYQELARQAVEADQTYEGYLLALVETEVQQRDENAHKKRIKTARFPVLKTLDQFDFTALATLNKAKVVDLARGDYIEKKENLILMGNSGTGKTHLAVALGICACQSGKNVRFYPGFGGVGKHNHKMAINLVTCIRWSNLACAYG